MKTQDEFPPDRRRELKVWIKCLAAESQILREEARRTPYSSERETLEWRRRCRVGRDSRRALLAYAFLRGVPRFKLEKIGRPDIDCATVFNFVLKYGPVDFKRVARRIAKGYEEPLWTEFINWWNFKPESWFQWEWPAEDSEDPNHRFRIVDTFQ